MSEPDYGYSPTSREQQPDETLEEYLERLDDIDDYTEAFDD